jgi:hypothetical protein
MTRRIEQSVPSQAENEIVCIPISVAEDGLTVSIIIEPPEFDTEIVTSGYD